MQKKKEVISREHIQGRILRSAAKEWGTSNSTLDSFDPLVGMMFGAVSSEIEKVYNEISTSQSRVLERLSGLLTPEVLKGARAAHGILRATSVEGNSVLPKDFQFFVQKRLPFKESTNREDLASVFFTPTTAVNLIDGMVRKIVYGNRCFEITKNGGREIAFESSIQKSFRKNLLYIGLEVSNKVETLNGSAFYFDWVNYPSKSYLFQLLELSKWDINGNTLATEVGIGDQEGRQDKKRKFEIELDGDISRIEELSISQLYNNRFITVNHDQNLILKNEVKNYPDAFAEVFGGAELKSLKDQLIWICIEFPHSIEEEVQEELVCLVNCFPIMNRKLNDFTYRLQPNTNIIPLKIENEFFYSIRYVRGSEGGEYASNLSAKLSKAELGTYILRQGGVERFDSRAAGEMLAYLIDLLRDESAAFAIYGNDMISTDLRELQQKLNSLHAKTDNIFVDEENVTYLIVKPKYDAENIFIEFWSSAGVFGNQIKSGTKLIPYSGSDVRPDTVELISTTLGGRDALTSPDTLGAYKKALMTRGRIVTPSDIRFVIERELGSRVKSIEIKRGIAKGVGTRQGLQRSIQALVEPSPETKLTTQEWNTMLLGVQAILMAESSGFFPIEVKLKTSN